MHGELLYFAPDFLQGQIMSPQKLFQSTTKVLVCLLMLFAISMQANAAIEAHQFDTDLQRQRYQSFIEEMRCPKCQNQNLAGSDSPISADLRREIYEMIKLGKSDKEIVDFMVDRYGDFILYRPRVTPVTYVLWAAPVALLVVGALVLMMMLRRRRRLVVAQMGQGLTTDEQARLDALLGAHQSNDNNAGEPRS